MHIEENEYSLAKEVCDEAFKVGQSHGASSLDLSKYVLDCIEMID